MFSCVGGFINLILHCPTTARADTATPPWLACSFCVCSKALPDMQIKAITRTNKDVWREEGRAEWGGQRREQGTARAKAVPGQFLPHSGPGLSWMLWYPPRSAIPAPLPLSPTSPLLSLLCLCGLSLPASSPPSRILAEPEYRHGEGAVS